MEKIDKILIFCSIGLLCTCVTDFEKVAPPTELLITIQNEVGTILTGADAFLYEDVGLFNQTISTGNPVGFVSTVQSVNGIAKFSQLKFDASYYLYILYKDNSLYTNTYISFDNSEEKFSLKNKLIRGSISSLRVVLKPADGLVTFWTAASNNSIVPIDVFYGTSAKGTVSQSFVAPPPLFQAGALTLRTRKGKVSFEGKSSSGCLWTNSITLAPLQSVFYQLEDCSIGTIAFFTDNTNSTKLPITIKLNANDGLPSLTSVVSTVPVDCSASNLSIALRIPGNYTYEAISPTGNCIWTGAFTLAANECKLIALPTCP